MIRSPRRAEIVACTRVVRDAARPRYTPRMSWRRSVLRLAGCARNASLAIGFAACASAQLPRGFDPEWVTITVVDASKRPVVGAEVSGPGASSLTDARGQVRLPYEERDTFHEFGVAAAGFVSIVHPTEDWHYGRDQLIELQPDEPIRVRVLEAGTDRALGGVRVGGDGRRSSPPPTTTASSRCAA